MNTSFPLHLMEGYAVTIPLMRPCKCLIIAALLPEAAAIARALRLPADFKEPLLYSPKISIALVGPRAVKLAQVTASVSPARVIMAGLAGALSPDLNIGNIIISCNDILIHTSNTLVSSPAEKAALFLSTGSQAVDMETDLVRAYAVQLNVPFTAIRAISDTAQESLDPAVLSLVDPEGRPVTSRALALLARHPSKLKMLLRLNRASKIALSNLSAALVAHLNG